MLKINKVIYNLIETYIVFHETRQCGCKRGYFPTLNFSDQVSKTIFSMRTATRVVA